MSRPKYEGDTHERDAEVESTVLSLHFRVKLLDRDLHVLWTLDAIDDEVEYDVYRLVKCEYHMLDVDERAIEVHIMDRILNLIRALTCEELDESLVHE
jgi:hypothetical protein